MKQRGIRGYLSHECPDSVTLHPGYTLEWITLVEHYGSEAKHSSYAERHDIQANFRVTSLKNPEPRFTTAVRYSTAL